MAPAPEICSVLPRNAGWRPALWCLCPCINSSGFVAWFSCMFLLRGPASAFRFCKHRPQSRPAPRRGAAWGGGRVSGLGFAFAVVTKNVRVAFLFYPVAPVPGAAWAHWALMQSGRGVGWGSPPARAGALLHSGGVSSRTSSPPRAPQGCGSLFSSWPRHPPPERVQCEGGRARGRPARAAGRYGRFGGSGALCPPRLSPCPGQEALGSWPCYFSTTE